MWFWNFLTRYRSCSGEDNDSDPGVMAGLSAPAQPANSLSPGLMGRFRKIGGIGIWLSLGGLAGIAIESLDSAVTAKVISMEAVTSLVLTHRFYVTRAALCGGFSQKLPGRCWDKCWARIKWPEV